MTHAKSFSKRAQHRRSDHGQRGRPIYRSESIAISGYLDALSEKERPRLIERVLGRAIPSGVITELKIERPKEDPKQPLVLRYRFNGRLNIPSRVGCFSMQPGRTFAGPSKRETALFLNIPIKQSVVMRLELPTGLEISQGTINLPNQNRQFERVVSQDGEQVEIRCQRKCRVAMRSARL